MALVGCMSAPSVPMAGQAADADAKQFQPPAGKANLYIAWSNDSSARVTLDVSVDGKLLGPIAPGMFYLATVDPGKHDVSAKSMTSSSNVSMNAEAGKNYFYELTASSGAYTAKPSLGVVLIEELGKMMVRQNKRAQGSDE
jgi:Protein of unknown function (DUF2846)